MVPRFLRDALNIRPGEGMPIALLGAYSFLIGIFLALFISLANASFLAEFGVDYLPHGYIVTGVVGYLAGAALSQLQSRLPLVGSWLRRSVVVRARLKGAPRSRASSRPRRLRRPRPARASSSRPGPSSVRSARCGRPRSRSGLAARS